MIFSFVALAFSGFFAGWHSARAYWVQMWLEDKEEEDLRKRRILFGSGRHYSARNERRVKLHQAKIISGRE